MHLDTLKLLIQIKLAVVLILLCLSITASAADRLVVVTHPDNQDVVTREDLYRLYFGKRMTLPSGTRLTPVFNDGDEELLKHFSSEMLQRSSRQFKSYWARQLFTGKAKPPVRVKNVGDLKDLIAGDPQFIGFLWESDLDATVRVVLPASEQLPIATR